MMIGFVVAELVFSAGGLAKPCFRGHPKIHLVCCSFGNQPNAFEIDGFVTCSDELRSDWSVLEPANVAEKNGLARAVGEMDLGLPWLHPKQIS